MPPSPIFNYRGAPEELRVGTGCNFPEILHRPTYELVFCILYFLLCSIFLCISFYFYGKSVKSARNEHKRNRSPVGGKPDDIKILQGMLSR